MYPKAEAPAPEGNGKKSSGSRVNPGKGYGNQPE